MSDASPGSNQCREDLNATLADHFSTQALLQGFDVDFFGCFVLSDQGQIDLDLGLSSVA
jgi:hypothetical protein